MNQCFIDLIDEFLNSRDSIEKSWFSENHDFSEFQLFDTILKRQKTQDA